MGKKAITILIITELGRLNGSDYFLYNQLMKQAINRNQASNYINEGTSHMDPQEQIAETERAVNEFISTIEELPEDLFLKPMNSWSPRDVTAHLIGWNQYTIEGCKQIIQGERPDYFKDADNNFSNVNAESVEKYASTDKINLLAECTDSFKDLKSFLESLTYQHWVNDYGVRYQDWVITVYNTVLALQKDYENHREEIENWAEKQNKP